MKPAHVTAFKPSVIFGPLHRPGTHPIFDDMEREAALRLTSNRLADWDVALLHRLLTDAHDRLAAMVPSSDLDNIYAELSDMEKERDTALKQLDQIQEKLENALATKDEAIIERDAAVQVEEEQTAARNSLQERFDALTAAHAALLAAPAKPRRSRKVGP